MKKINTATIIAIAMMVSVTVWADTNTHENTQVEMPMMNNDENSSMSEPRMTKKFTKGDHQIEHHMSNKDDGNHGMMMDPHMMQMMMAYHQQHNMNSMGSGNSGTRGELDSSGGHALGIGSSLIGSAAQGLVDPAE